MRLPPDAVEGAGDPTRAAIITTANVFAAPGSIAGQPALAARAAAQLEYLVVEIPTGPRWRGFSPNVSLALERTRPELRSALGIDPAAPPQAVIDSLYATSRALTADDRAALDRILVPPLYPAGPTVTLQRLSALPFLPQANFATALAAREMNRLDDDGGRRGFGGFRF
ncbi:hypothetical protein [Roseicella aerolata]|uniref:Uncharacterized protein n=1 Tax=Roseicella aerolata TaxID=2883479 RepID=A0A9X1IKP7_9PROT|nr:hypothetical protein [Roseicella aerolata]MCB4825178.1 hypothetical protein [Roseicella aerolata]